MNGRTDGGMAGALRERRDLPDPPSDEWLEPAATFYLRYHVRGALRKCWPIQSQVSEVVRKYFGTEADQLLCQPWPLFFGQLIRVIETDSERLKRVRMTQSDCRRELPHLQRLHAQLLAERELSQSGLYDPLSVAAAE